MVEDEMMGLAETGKDAWEKSGMGGPISELNFDAFPYFLLATGYGVTWGSIPVMRQGRARTPVLAATREAS